MLKKGISISLIAILIATTASFAANSAETLAEYGVIEKNSTGYAESSNITRAEFMVILSKLYGEKNIQSYTYKNQFKDVSSSDWFAPYIAFALDKKVTSGISVESFGPNQTVTYDQAALFIIKALGYESSFDQALGKAYDLKLLAGINVKRGLPITRGEIFTMVGRALEQPYNGDQAPLKLKLGLGSSVSYRNIQQMQNFGLSKAKLVSSEFIEVTFNMAPGYLLKEEALLKIDGSLSPVKSTIQLTPNIYLLQVNNVKGKKAIDLQIGNSVEVKAIDFDGGKFAFIPSASRVTNTNTVILQFNKPVDPISGLDKNNYLIDGGLLVTSVSYFTDMYGSVDYTKLVLKTSEQNDGKLYNLRMTTVKDQEQMSLLSSNAVVNFAFGGVKKDNTSPIVERAFTRTNSDVYVSFKDESGIDASSALNMANYSLKTVDKGTNLAITKVEPIANEFGQINEIKLITEQMSSNTPYILEMNGIKDTLGNQIANLGTNKYSFPSKLSDTERPRLEQSYNTSANQIRLTFNEGLIKETAENVNNYSFDKDELKVRSAKLTGPDNNIIVLETSDQPSGKSFKLYVSGLTDYFGNAMPKNDATAYFFGNGGDLTKPKVESVDSQNLGGRNLVTVSFSKDMNIEDMLNKNNYDFGKLGKALYVEKINERQIRVYTEDQVKFELYTLTVSNVKDNTNINLNGGTQTLTFAGAGL